MEINSGTSANERTIPWPLLICLILSFVTGENLLILIRLRAFGSHSRIFHPLMNPQSNEPASWLTSRAMDDLFRQQRQQYKKNKLGKLFFHSIDFPARATISLAILLNKHQLMEQSSKFCFNFKVLTVSE